MMKAVEHTGFWWDPRDPGTRWPGTLKFDPVAGATLARTIGFHPRQIFDQIQEFDILHGETTGGIPISLLHCFERNGSDIFANAVIVGFHAAKPDPLIRVAAAVIENLNEWWGQRALAHESGLTFPNVGLRYVQPEPVVLHDDGTLRTAVHSSPLASFERTRS